jgi:8-oxo-dGTP diphosphatase
MNLFWRPREQIFYRSWIGDGAHSVSVDAQFEGSGYSAAFKISGDFCELWLFPVSVKVRRKTDTFSDSVTRRALILNLPRRDVDISKQIRRELLQAGEVNEERVDFDWVRYSVKIKKINADDELKFLQWQKSSSLVPEKQIVRRRGTAIVDSSLGILLVSGKGRLFQLPGSGAKKDESRMDAAHRGLKEGTGLTAKNCRYLFSFDDPEDKKLRNLHKVFLVETDGTARNGPPESGRCEYWHEGSKLKISNSTSLIIDRYMREFKSSYAENRS